MNAKYWHGFIYNFPSKIMDTELGNLANVAYWTI